MCPLTGGTAAACFAAFRCWDSLSGVETVVKARALTQIINLRQARKRRKRVEKEQQAADNRAKFGRTKADQKQNQAEQARSKRVLEDHRLEDDD